MKKVKPSLFFVIFLIILALSCSPLRHYYRVAEDTDITNDKKSILSGWVAKAFPDSTPAYIQGKTITVIDSSWNQPVIDSLLASIDSLSVGGDTLNIDSLKAAILTKCKPLTKWITATRVDTVVRVDSSTIYSLVDSVDVYKAKADGLQKVLDNKDNSKPLTIGLIATLMITGFQAYIIYTRKERRAAKKNKSSL